MKKINLIGIILAFFAGIGVGWVALKNKIFVYKIYYCGNH